MDRNSSFLIHLACKVFVPINGVISLMFDRRKILILFQIRPNIFGLGCLAAQREECDIDTFWLFCAVLPVFEIQLLWILQSTHYKGTIQSTGS
jgi:hypothetical protein